VCPTAPVRNGFRGMDPDAKNLALPDLRPQHPSSGHPMHAGGEVAVTGQDLPARTAPSSMARSSWFTPKPPLPGYVLPAASTQPR
ncbi:MAG TPA: hypothetical protein VFI82_17565, partial [Terriglobales bacterium]|nr:hypothetical protein [Terriglobales bacterium]